MATAGKVVNLESGHGAALSFEQIEKAVSSHKPAVLFLCQVQLGPGSILLCLCALTFCIAQRVLLVQCHAALPPGTVPPVHQAFVPSMLGCPQD